MRLQRALGTRENRPEGSVVDVLVATILSQNTSRANSTAGYRRLRRELPTWDAVADAPVGRIADCIRVSGLWRRKAPRIRQILRQIRGRYGRIDLQALAELPQEKARQELLSFEGVGAKTASCVLLFALNRPVLPVDTHVARLAVRLGWVAGKTSPERIETLLTAASRPKDRYELHMLLIELGRNPCRARRPQCLECPLAKLCPTGLASQAAEGRECGPD